MKTTLVTLFTLLCTLLLPDVAHAAAVNAPPVGITAAPDGKGYWIATRDGGVFSFGSAHFFGSMGGQHLNAPVVGMAAAPDGNGYWLTASDGGIFAFGSARFYGSMGGKPLNKPVVGIAATPSGHGYWEVASDGGIFAFGDAGFFGSMGGKPLNQPIVGLTAAAGGGGYWEVAADGGIFAFGRARFYGSTGGQRLNAPIVGMAGTRSGLGYRFVGADGGAFNYGDAGAYGSMGGQPLAAPMVGIATQPSGGYWMLGADGGVFAFGSAQYYGRVVFAGPATPGVGQQPSHNYALVLPRNSVSLAKLTGRHHDYPAVDIPVPDNTPFYAVTSGTALLFTDRTCGNGIQLNADDGGQWVYCHATSRAVGNGTRVAAGRQLGLTGHTGDATGPHLHLQVKYPTNLKRCPQPLLQAIYNNASIPSLASLPTAGCTL